MTQSLLSHVRWDIKLIEFSETETIDILLLQYPTLLFRFFLHINLIIFYTVLAKTKAPYAILASDVFFK